MSVFIEYANVISCVERAVRHTLPSQALPINWRTDESLALRSVSTARTFGFSDDFFEAGKVVPA